MAYQPKASDTDANRNLISNIHARGVSAEQAAERILKLAAVDDERLRQAVINFVKKFQHCDSTRDNSIVLVLHRPIRNLQPLSMIANASRNCCSLMHSGGLVKKVFQRTNV